MRIAQFEKFSLIDMPGYISCVIYTQGCNMNCVFCHNSWLIPKTEPTNPVQWSQVLAFLIKRKNHTEAVVFSGGEPTIQHDLIEHMQEIKDLGFKVGLHTNGTGPEFNDAVKLCDYVLLSKHTPETIEVAKQAVSLNLSTVTWDEAKGAWNNKITAIK